MTAPLVGVLGQAAPAANTVATLYTVPAGRRSVGSTLSIAETSGVSTSFNVYVSATGATGGSLGVGNATGYQILLSANNRYAFTEGIALQAGATISVLSNSGHVTFTLHGEESDIPSLT